MSADASGDQNLVYDVLGRTTDDSWSDGIFEGLEITNHFNPVYGRDALVANGLSSTLETDYGYDTYGRMNSVSSGSGSSAAGYGYLPNSDLLKTTACSNSTGAVLNTTRQWDHGFRLGSIANTVNGAAVTSHGYTYDNLNRRTKAALEDGSKWNYAYNNRSELTGAGRSWPDGSSVTGQQYGYGFDNIGNRTNASSGSSGNLRAASYTANNLNEYTAITTPGYKDILGLAPATNAVTVNGGTADRKGEYFHQEITVANGGGPLWQGVSSSAGNATVAGGLVFPAGSQTLLYDADGNLTFDGVWNYKWDAENRLIEMTMTNISGIAPSNRLRLDFGYDFMNRRVSKVVSTNAGGSAFVPQTTNYFVYDGWNLIAAFGPGNTIQQSFAWGLDLSRTMTKAGGIGGLLAITTSGTNYYPTWDGNGNITGLINGSDKSTGARYEYNPFGEVIRATGPMAKANPFRFSTKFRDDESGLVYYGYRYYNPAQGRWIGRDSAGEQKGGNNLFAFCNNNSFGSIDPDGKTPVALTVLFRTIETLKQQMMFVEGTPQYALYEGALKQAEEKLANTMASLASYEGIEAEEAVSTTIIEGISFGGVAPIMATGLVVGFVVDETAKGLGAMAKELEAANDAAIDYWSDPNTPGQQNLWLNSSGSGSRPNV